MVDKVLQYHDIKSLKLRNNVVIITDDSDIPSDASLQDRQNKLADLISMENLFQRQ
jgi:hypothetical protein